MELKETKHNYYCSENNFYVGNHNGENYGRSEYDNWKSFKEEWLNDDCSIDCDYNLCFRYDIYQNRNHETDELTDGYQLWLFFVLQRKGIYRPVFIKNLEEKDMEELKIFLKQQWDYTKEQWIELQ